MICMAIKISDLMAFHGTLLIILVCYYPWINTNKVVVSLSPCIMSKNLYVPVSIHPASMAFIYNENIVYYFKVCH